MEKHNPSTSKAAATASSSSSSSTGATSPERKRKKTSTEPTKSVNATSSASILAAELRRSGIDEEALRKLKETSSRMQEKKKSSADPMDAFRTASPKTSGNGLICPELPNSCNRRCCLFCGHVLALKRSLIDHFSGSTLSEHLNSSSCLFVRANVEDGVSLSCPQCGKEFDISKSMITRFLTHVMYSHDTDFRCIYCDERVLLNDMFDHLKIHARSAAKKISCKRCNKLFTTAPDFFCHLKEVHLVASPNVNTINNSICDDLDQRQLAVFAVFLAKHGCI